MNDACEKALIGSIQKFSIEDGPGIRTTIFIKGCPLSCRWCHNPEMIDFRQQLIKSPNSCIGCGYCAKTCPREAIVFSREEGVLIDNQKCDMCLACTNVCYAKALRPVAKLMSVDEVLEAAFQDKRFYDNTGGGITVSGGEILSHAKFVSELIDKAGKLKINACLDTCGFGDPGMLMKLALKENVTHILYDMKSIDDNIHREYTGVSNSIIKENLKMLARESRTLDKLIMRMPLVKGVNDTEDIIRHTGKFYKEIGIKRVDLLPYHNLGISKKRNIGGEQEEFQKPDDDRLKDIEAYFRDEININVGILGGV